MGKIRAVVTDPQSKEHLRLVEVDAPEPKPSEALVRMAAFSLNRGEVRRAFSAQTSYAPGWDLSGIVEQPASDGSGPKAGERVVGLVPAGAWSELAAVPTNALAALPESVTFSQAATLPVAGLTALLAFQKVGSMLARRVLVTGASGGVGNFAVQLGALSGATVTGLIQHPEFAGSVRQASASQVVVNNAAAAAAFGPYHLICDGVGGAVLSAVAAMLAPGGMCVTYAALLQPEITVNLRPFIQAPTTSLTGMLVFNELRNQPAKDSLERLVALVADGRLHPHVAVEAPWSHVAEVCQQLIDRKFPGKAVLTIS